MPKGRKPDPNQYALVPGGDPSEYARKEEEKNSVRRISYEWIVAHCTKRDLSKPSSTEWRNAQEVATYLIHVEGASGIFPSVERIAKYAFRVVKSKAVAERALRLLKDLRMFSAIPRGPLGNEYVKHINVIHQMAVESQSVRRTCDPDTTDFDGENDGLAIRGYNPEPTNTQPTSSSSSRVLEDEEERLRSFIAWIANNPALAGCIPTTLRDAVVQGRANGCTIEQLQARVVWFGEHRHEWRPSHQAGALASGIKRAVPGMAPNESWPPRSVQRQSDADFAAKRRQSAEERERCRREWIQQRLSMEKLAAEIDPALARDIAAARKKRERRENAAEPRPP